MQDAEHRDEPVIWSYTLSWQEMYVSPQPPSARCLDCRNAVTFCCATLVATVSPTARSALAPNQQPYVKHTPQDPYLQSRNMSSSSQTMRTETQCALSRAHSPVAGLGTTSRQKPQCKDSQCLRCEHACMCCCYLQSLHDMSRCCSGPTMCSSYRMPQHNIASGTVQRSQCFLQSLNSL